MPSLNSYISLFRIYLGNLFTPVPIGLLVNFVTNVLPSSNNFTKRGRCRGTDILNPGERRTGLHFLSIKSPTALRGAETCEKR